MLYKQNTIRNKIFLLFFAIFTTHLFNYVNWNPTIAGWCSYFIYGYLFYIFYTYKNITLRIKSPIKHWIKFYIAIPLLCLITEFVIHGNSPYHERSLIFSLLTFLVFYYYYIYKISEKEIVSIFTIIALIIFAIQIIQQLSPSKAIFGIQMPDSTLATNIAEVRNGLYRFRISGVFFTLFCLYYYWSNVCKKANKSNVILFTIFLVSMYLFLTRQIMFATLLTIIISSRVVTNPKTKRTILIGSIIIGILIFVFSDVLFDSLIKQTSQESNDENIRLLAASFYWEQITSNPLSFIFGNGHPQEFNIWQKNYRFFSSDIGFIGEMYHYGILWIIFYFYTLYLLLIKHRKRTPLYIKLFLIGTSLNSFMIFPYRSPYEYFVWTSVIYIASLYIPNKKHLSKNIYEFRKRRKGNHCNSGI